MSTLRAAIIGCGRKKNHDLSTGFGIAHHHVGGYLAREDVEIVALCDLLAPRAEAFRREYDLAAAGVFTDHRRMLAEARPDVVSICTWPASHAALTLDCAAAGVRAVHCEKPMALTWGQARRMAAGCADRGVQLTFNHQRRFGPAFRKVRELVDSQAIGRLLRIEAYTVNLFDWGTHWFDMMFYFNGDGPAEWVLGQVHLRGAGSVFGAPLEAQGLSMVHFANGVTGWMCTGGKGPRDVAFRLLGADGLIELGDGEGVGLRVLGGSGGGWEQLDPAPKLHGPQFHAAAVADLLDALRDGREPELSARKALQATEVIFATYESARRGGRIDLPLTIEDSPLAALLAAGGR